MTFGLKNNAVEQIITVFTGFPEIEKAIVYGSRAKGNFRKGSDIDLTLVGNSLNLRTLNAIELKLDDLLLPYTFDLSIYHHIANQELVEHISRVGQVLYAKEPV